VSRPRGPDVVAAWGLANAVLLGVLIGYGDRAAAIAVYAGSVGLIELLALGAWWVMSAHPVWAATSPEPRRSRASMLVAAIAAAVGVGAVWDWWFALAAVYPAGALVMEIASERREPLPESSDGPPAEHRRLPSRHIGEVVLAGASVGAVAAAVRAWRRRFGRAG
jgi:hypothetical protein